MQKLKYFFSLVKRKNFRGIYNNIIVYFLWVSKFWQKIFLGKIFPMLGIELYPPFVEIEVSTACNLKCKICEHTYWKEKPRIISFQEFKNIVDQFPKLRWVGFVGIGGNFCNPNFMKMVRYVKETSKATVEIADTFLNIDEKISRELIELGVDFMQVSVWGTTKQTYEKLMVGSNFEKAMNNIRTFTELKKKMKSYIPAPYFHFVYTKENIHEAVSFVEFIHSICPDPIMLEFTPVLHAFEEVKDMYIEMPDEMAEEIKAKAKEYNMFVYFNLSSIKEKKPINECARWIMPFVFATGEVVPCCVANEANARETQKINSLGNIFNQNFREIWCGEKYTQFRNSIRSCKVPVQCVNCTIFKIK